MPSVGKQTITTLLRKFKSAKRVKSATLEELVAEVGNTRAKIIFDYFNKKS
ncbi:MAG: helix-hairpin-helix domain-containing protein [Polaribacter sp.]|nr:helix-hairpin-helix domain-containing protein [Polaribacter sp.]